MSQPYTKMKGIADRLFAQFGHSINLIDSSKTVIDTYQGLKSSVKNQDTLGSLIQGADTMVYITSGSVIPDTTHYLDMDGSIWKIIYVDTVRPTDTTIMFTLYVKNGA